MPDYMPKPLYDERCAIAMAELMAACGRMSDLSRMIGVPHSTVQGWVKRGRISRDGARRVACNKYLKKQFAASYLRPDLED